MTKIGKGKKWSMSPSQKVAKKVVEVLEVFASKQAHFTFPQLRQLAGIQAEGNNNAHLWNIWRSLEEANVVEELPTGRKRNRIFRVARPERLTAFRPVASTDDLQDLRDAEVMSETVESRLDRLEGMIKQLAQKVDSLAS